MGNKASRYEQWQQMSFRRTSLPDVNEFCQEIGKYNKKINELRDALEIAEQSLILYLGLDDVEKNLEGDENFKITIEDVTISLFYAFSSFFKGDYQKMLDLKFNDDPPYFEVNIHYLDPLLKDCWIAYQKFITHLQNTSAFCQALVNKYTQYYKDYYERFIEYMEEIKNPKEIYEIENLQHNYNEVLRVGENLGLFKTEVEEKYVRIKRAIERIKEGQELSQVAIICKVNKLRYPNECYNKIMQMRAVTKRPTYLEEFYLRNQQLSYERYMFVTNKYKLIENNDEDDIEQKEMLALLENKQTDEMTSEVTKTQHTSEQDSVKIRVKKVGSSKIKKTRIMNDKIKPNQGILDNSNKSKSQIQINDIAKVDENSLSNKIKRFFDSLKPKFPLM